MFQNLQTWQIVAIAVGIIAVIGIIFYMRRDKKDETKENKKGLIWFPKILASANSSQITRATTSGQAAYATHGSDVRELQNSDIPIDLLLGEIGKSLCGKPLNEAMMPELIKKLPTGDSFMLYIFFSDKISDLRKMDFITALEMYKQILIAKRNPEGRQNLPKLLNDSTVICNNYQFCNGQDKIRVGDLGKNIFNELTQLFDPEKLPGIVRRNNEKQKIEQAKENERLQREGSQSRVGGALESEAEIQQLIQERMNKLQTIKAKILANPLCNFY